MIVVFLRSTITANCTPRSRILNGREYWVVPLSLIVPGVLNGSQGALYYPPDECQRNVDAWNGMPLTYYHPTDNGDHVSAKSPGILADHGIGFVAKSGFNGKLRAQGWFDVERVRNADRRFGADLYGKLSRGEPVELSTGLFTENEPCQGSHNGRQYDYIARNYKPDHIAVLPDQVGACSIQDGCGVGVVNRKPPCKPGGG